jgi:hypothetical protein
VAADILSTPAATSPRGYTKRLRHFRNRSKEKINLLESEYYQLRKVFRLFTPLDRVSRRGDRPHASTRKSAAR